MRIEEDVLPRENISGRSICVISSLHAAKKVKKTEDHRKVARGRMTLKRSWHFAWLLSFVQPPAHFV
jgi:hypothetical protein